jgi:serine/threonine-protein kinase
MLALRRVAQRVLELTEMMMISMVPAVAGRAAHLKFAIGMLGPSIDEARHVVEQVVAQVQGLMPESLELMASVVRADPDQPVELLLDF